MNSKMLIVVFPRKKKLTKEQLAIEVARCTSISMVSAGKLDEKGNLHIDLLDYRDQDLRRTGLPREWFNGDYNVEVSRILEPSIYKFLYYYCNAKQIPVFNGVLDEEDSCLVIGPYWAEIINEALNFSISRPSQMRTYTGSNKEINNNKNEREVT